MIKRTLAVLVLVWVALCVVLFVLHDGDRPSRADAVVVLSGSDERLPVGARLVREGFAPLLVVSRSHQPTVYEQRLCAHAARVLCFHAQPYSTQGEAREIARLARERKWSRVDVVTSKFHVFRAKRMIERCYHGELRVVAAPDPSLYWFVRDVALESVKLVYHELVRGC